jgi:hypothetical protein
MERRLFIFSLIAIGAGLGLFGSYQWKRKWWEENRGMKNKIR